MKRAIVCALACAFFLKLFLFDFVLTEGRSMAPALRNGSLLLVNKIAYGVRLPLAGGYAVRWAAPREGEVVVFWTPYGDLAVKRCAGADGGGFFTALGDNRAASFDSRDYGPVSAERVVGRALGVK